MVRDKRVVGGFLLLAALIVAGFYFVEFLPHI